MYFNNRHENLKLVSNEIYLFLGYFWEKNKNLHVLYREWKNFSSDLSQDLLAIWKLGLPLKGIECGDEIFSQNDVIS